MDKHTLFSGYSEAGVFAQGLFASMEKTAGVPGMGQSTADQIRHYIKNISKDDRSKNCYVLVNALGAGEFYGSNINADYFPWNSLTHQGMDYGYQTFYNSHAFAHHVNKDPTRAFGVPVLSVINPRMRRVELIIKLDREKARHEGADGVITRIDNGEFPDVSMGCKVPYDVCSICGNESKTRDDYCKHMRPPEDMRHVWGPNKILEDGRRVCVLNLHPRFFDISFVFIGADKTAKVMAKLQPVGDLLCIGSICALPNNMPGPVLYTPRGDVVPYHQEKRASACDERTGPCGRKCADCAEKNSCEMEKLASGFGVKVASKKKLSEMVKAVPAGSMTETRLHSLEANEGDLPDDVLERLSGYPLPNALGTPASAGIVLKPREFQRIVLIRMGHRDFADELDHDGLTFRNVRRFEEEPDLDMRAVSALLQAIAPYIHSRTAYGPPLRVRLIQAGSTKKTLPTKGSIEHPLMDKISAAYNGYRRNILTKLSQAREEVLSDPKLREAVLGRELVNMFVKTSSSEEIVTPDTVAYMLGAHLSDRSLLTTGATALRIAAAYPRLLREHTA